jgi:hypothetical protein
MKKILLGSLVLGSSVLFSACTLQPQADYSVTDTEMVELDPSLIEDGNAAKRGAPTASIKPALNSDEAKKVDPKMVEKNKALMMEETTTVIE